MSMEVYPVSGPPGPPGPPTIQVLSGTGSPVGGGPGIDPPTVIPSIYIDTNNGDKYYYYSGQWN